MTATWQRRTQQRMAAMELACLLIAIVPRLAGSAEPDAPPHAVVLGPVRHAVVSDVGAKNRTEIGIGEDVRLWIDSFGAGVVESDLPGEIVWTTTGATVYPLVGTSTIMTADQADTDQRISIRRTWRDPASNGRKRTAWQPDLNVPQGVIEKRSAEDYAAETKVYLKLVALRKHLNGLKTDADAVEESGSELLEEARLPRDRAMLHCELAYIHAQSGLRRPELVIQHAREALRLPLDSSRRLRLQVYWGDALRVISGVSFPERRRAAARIYLQGLKEVAGYTLPEEPPKLPLVFRPDANEGREEELRRRELQRQWKLARHVREMINHRDVLKQQLASLYRRKPFANDELRELATDCFRNEESVTALMKSLKRKTE